MLVSRVMGNSSSCGALYHALGGYLRACTDTRKESGLLKDQADFLKRQLEDIERRIQKLEKKDKF